MISERQCIRIFPQFWRQAFPNFNDHFNEVFHRRATPLRFVTEWSHPITPSAETKWNDMIAELAFTAFSRGVNISKQSESQQNITEDDINAAIIKMGMIRGQALDRRLVTKEILHDAEVIRARLITYFAPYHVTVHPTLRGFGALNALHPDMIVGQTIYEVKASKFNFKREDLKQLLVYYLLSQVNDLKITRLCLTNPRRGVDYSIDASDLQTCLGAPSRSQLLQLFKEALRG